MNWKYNSVPILWSHNLSTFEFRIMKGNGTNCFPLPSLPPVSSCPLYCNRVVYGNEGKTERRQMFGCVPLVCLSCHQEPAEEK